MTIFWLNFSWLSGTLGLVFFLGDAAMPAEEAARALRIWATEQNLMATEIPGAPVVEAPGAVVPLPAINQQAVNVFQKAGIVCIGFDETRSEVIVFTSRKLSKRNLGLVPAAIGQNVNIVYEVASTPEIGKSPPPPVGNAPAVLHNDRYTCGSSVFVGRRSGAGTLGCLVSDVNGDLYGLSNNHVSGDCNFAPIGLPVVAPGPVDVAANGVDPFTIGHHTRGLQMNAGTPDNLAVQHMANLDAAIFRIKDAEKLCSMQKGFYDTPAATGPLVPGMIVEKVGRTTGRTIGAVRAQISGPECVRYAMPDIAIDIRVYFEPIYIVRSGQGIFSTNGDSGSLVTGFDNNQQRIAVGLVIAGDNKGNSFVLPLVNILNTLAVSLVSGHNV